MRDCLRKNTCLNHLTITRREMTADPRKCPILKEDGLFTEFAREFRTFSVLDGSDAQRLHPGVHIADVINQEVLHVAGPPAAAGAAADPAGTSWGRHQRAHTRALAFLELAVRGSPRLENIVETARIAHVIPFNLPAQGTQMPNPAWHAYDALKAAFTVHLADRCVETRAVITDQHAVTSTDDCVTTLERLVRAKAMLVIAGQPLPDAAFYVELERTFPFVAMQVVALRYTTTTHDVKIATLRSHLRQVCSAALGKARRANDIARRGFIEADETCGYCGETGHRAINCTKEGSYNMTARTKERRDRDRSDRDRSRSEKYSRDRPRNRDRARSHAKSKKGVARARRGATFTNVVDKFPKFKEDDFCDTESFNEYNRFKGFVARFAHAEKADESTASAPENGDESSNDASTSASEDF